MKNQNEQQGVWKYQCIGCKQFFPSSQSIAAHTRGHFKDGWVKGTRQRKIFVPFTNYQQGQQQGSTTSLVTHLTKEEEEVALILLDISKKQVVVAPPEEPVV
ncbi:hypothetical protein HAX54_023588 [Datura stramonium]|uniref:C2H2-type domain-containing protein n=1 Tax=Datura stramonium TaxID=4076 RepID=A0ABS8UZF2_DATST|nr:hypothetical protein [Datura stramonium]